MNAITKHDEGRTVAHLPADPMVSMIERIVLNPDADLDKLERMLALKRDHDRDNARIAFARALAAARAQIPPIMKDATVDFTSSKGRTYYQHETLAGIARVIDPILSEFGLSYRFRTNQGNGGVCVTCIIAHADGHSEETSLTCAPDGSGNKNPFQAVGSAVTYLQRYTLKASLGLSAEVDDDAQAAAPRREDRDDHQQENRQQQRQERPKPTDMSDKADHMVSVLKERGLALLGSQKFNADLKDLRAADAQSAARVEAEIETQKNAAALDGDAITY